MVGLEMMTMKSGSPLVGGWPLHGGRAVNQRLSESWILTADPVLLLLLRGQVTASDDGSETPDQPTNNINPI